MKMLVPQKGLPKSPKPFLLLKILADFTLGSMLLVVVVVDLVAWIYQEIYFGVKDIPKIKRSNYVIMTRHKLKGLTVLQKWSCWYCEYVNSVISWVKRIANQTEIYSCAIKYGHKYYGQEYQEKFYDQDVFAQ